MLGSAPTHAQGDTGRPALTRLLWIPKRGTVDHAGLTRSTRAQSDSDAGAQDVLYGETQDERE